VLILSAYRAEEARIELGAQDGLSKPFDPDILVDRLEDLLNANLAQRGGPFESESSTDKRMAGEPRQ